MTREIAVLGAGMVGVSIAWHLTQRGHRVVLIDRKMPGRETSYGNAGMIQREAVSPHPFPRSLLDMWRVLPNRRIDIRYRAGAMLSSATALLEYWRYSSAEHMAEIVPQYASLIEHCTAEHERMFTAAGAGELIHRDGFVELYRSADVLAERLPVAASYRDDYGVEFDSLSAGDLAELEPDLAAPMAGAIRWSNTWGVTDPGTLVQRYAESFVANGGELMQAEMQALEPTGAGWRIVTDQGDITADQCVLATGPWSGQWLEHLGLSMPFFVMRGYHMHYATQPGKTLRHALLDYERGYLITPKSRGVRLTTGAELNTLDAPNRQGQLRAAEATARELFPLAERLEETPWRGARPCLSDMKPVIGPIADKPGLWGAFGHGHQGFTLGPVTGRMIGEMMDGETSFIDPSPFAADRF